MNFDFGLKDFVDIFLVGCIIYYLYKLMKDSGVRNLFVGVMIFILSWFLVVYVFQLKLLGSLLNRVIDIGAIAFVVIFQSELRRFFSQLGSRSRMNIFKVLFSKLFTSSKSGGKQLPVMSLVLACRNMARGKVGALIVIERYSDLSEIVRTGDLINADINARLIENIFFKNSPLHDGAMLITHNRIKAAACILPVSKSPDIPRHFGLRHRAALGICEQTDAVVIVVSEETGVITMAMDGAYLMNVSPEVLERELSLRFLAQSATATAK